MRLDAISAFLSAMGTFEVVNVVPFSQGARNLAPWLFIPIANEYSCGSRELFRNQINLDIG